MKAYNSDEGIQELRTKGFPWVVATCLLAVFMLSGVVFYFIITAETDKNDHTKNTVEDPSPIEVEFSETINILEKDGHSDLSTPKISRRKIEKISSEWPAPVRSTRKKFLHAAVSCQNEFCAEIGRDVLIRGGNAVDSAIATVICTGAVHPHQSGFGGGMVMLVHNRSEIVKL
ncbi:hypothetical protein DICVIV_02300 [Dictyocaulus viviparus]|uniref:Gamma-glutamyltranspeptidase n=1 Tax=Dictyocaulus viviparus TaxID=29172 RepID=A0A0D8Y3V2_DICVI|nr:hypothetical protein DICVIV_02300 [Dictyocaulus viviparus]